MVIKEEEILEEGVCFISWAFWYFPQICMKTLAFVLHKNNYYESENVNLNKLVKSPSELEGPQNQGGGSSYLLDAQPDSITKCLTFEKLLNLSLPQFLI